ncbi:hypothetical protein LP123_04015 [Moraxella bovis]|uniref:Uncharacterized protein n=1 Tax=Moraxella bovis TaxID=476 RepID=A0AAQ2Q4W2_MORBO|nr:hypothetical protein [Moraxella bovis]UYZ75128.1 hypothetical protein LP093_10225 [Moraxella bovis]UYZ78940.1 hypothetical protein LP115_03625 [Moraxella bovis]UYZ80473.1 hypothetical protein LP113_10590 [Moraxella bovis]UYZ87423.1 hypothetical protein LP094_03640 [Moraxella bovis]UYZ90159.1 hypothetical protein LP114_03510 [Moraxella bovis]
MGMFLLLCCLFGIIALIINFAQNDQKNPTPQTRLNQATQPKNYTREIALGLEYLAQNYEQTKNIIENNGFFSSNHDKNAWSYAFEIEIAYFQLIIFKHCIMLYDRSRINWIKYTIDTMPDENSRNVYRESIRGEIQAEYKRMDVEKEKGQNIAQGIENRWIELILKVYGLNYNENNISIVKNLLKERNDFYVEILAQLRGKKKETHNGDFYIKFLEFCEQHYEFRSNRGFEQNYVPIFLQMYQNFLEQASREKVIAGFMYNNEHNETASLVKGRVYNIKDNILNTWNFAVKYRQATGNPLPPNS